MWFAKIMVRFFMAIDSTLFNFIATLYDLLIAISRTSILSQGDIAQFASRIELLLGIFMLFKLSFSLITYVVNPDDFSDKSKGFGKLIQNAVISLAMLVLVPYAFQMAFNLQAKILDDNLLAKLLLGDKLTDVDSDGTETNATIMDSAGHTMAFQVMLPFFSPRVSLSSLNECIRIYDEDGFNDSCYDALADAGLGSPAIENYTKGIENNSLGLTFRTNTALAETEEDDEKYFIIDYKYPIATVVAVVVCLLLITFCIDVGVRSVKLAFLQLVYTIPVISYMDPKSGKDGLFKKWYQMCFSTFISLFIRLLALYFGIYIIIRVGDFGMYDVVNGSEITNGWVKLFVIIGVLMFVKQMPKILENLGFKLDGGFNLNPLKKLEDGMIGGKQIIGTGKKIGKRAGKIAGVGIGGAALVGGASLLTGKGLRGTGKAMRKAFAGGFKGDKFGKNFASSYGAGAARKREVKKMRNDGVSPGRVSRENFKNMFRGMTAKDKYEDFSNSMKSIQDGYKSYYNGVLGGDKIAKEFERRRVAAENAGDHAAMKMWQDSIDARVKEVQENGGQIALNGYKDSAGKNIDYAGQIADSIERVGGVYGAGSATYDSYMTGYAGSDYASKVNSTDQGLVNISNNISSTIEHVNERYAGSYDYDGSLSATADIKTINGKTKAAVRAAESSAEVREMQDVYKYVKTDSKK